jgi:hypothetical protein
VNTLALCAVAAYVVAVCAWAWSVRTPEPRPVFVPANVQFCQDWRDGQASLCERIPFRKEWAI